MRFHEALAKIGQVVGGDGSLQFITVKGNKDFYASLNNGILFGRDGKPLRPEIFANPSLYTREDFTIGTILPEGWDYNGKNEIVKYCNTERWINVYYDRGNKCFMERDHRAQSIADLERKQMANGTIIFLTQVHMSSQYTLKHDEVFGKSETVTVGTSKYELFERDRT